jgi:hypothetical protein
MHATGPYDKYKVRFVLKHAMYRDITIRLQCISLETFILKEAGWVLEKHGCGGRDQIRVILSVTSDSVRTMALSGHGFKMLIHNSRLSPEEVLNIFSKYIRSYLE